MSSDSLDTPISENLDFLDDDHDEIDSNQKSYFDFNCPICHFKEKLMIIINCGHSICQSCSEQLPSLNCPICRTPFYTWMLVENKIQDENVYLPSTSKSDTNHLNNSETTPNGKIGDNSKGETLSSVVNAINQRRLNREKMGEKFIKDTVDTILETYLNSLKQEIITKTKFRIIIDCSALFFIQLADQVAERLQNRLSKFNVQVKNERPLYKDNNNYFVIAINSYEHLF